MVFHVGVKELSEGAMLASLVPVFILCIITDKKEE